MLVIGLVLLLGGAIVVNGAESPHGTGAVGLVAATEPGLPLPTVQPCEPDSPLPVCTLPTPTTLPPVSGLPLPTSVLPCATDLPLPQSGCIPAPTTPTTSTTPCTGFGCIPQPGATTTPGIPGTPGQPGGGGNGDADCGISDIGGCITNAINGFFRGIVESALNPLLDLLSKTLLTTPSPNDLPRIGELWNQSWGIVLVCYSVLILIAGIVLMGYETVQTRHGVKEIAPRIVVGFLAGALSLWVATRAIELANALAQAIMGGGVEAVSAGETLRNLIMGSLNGGIWIIFIGIFIAGTLVALLLTYVVRVAVTVVLVAGAPLALMFHVLPSTEGIARWWWRTFGACLTIQLCQSLTLVTAMRVFLAPGGFTLFGPTASGLVNLLVALALMVILFRIPSWLMKAARGGGGSRSLIGSAIRGFIAFKTLGWLRGGAGRAAAAGSVKPRRPAPTSGGSSTAGQQNSWWNWRTRRAQKWIAPQPGMLPMRLRRPTGDSTVGQHRHTLADELNDPARVMPWQQPTDADHPDLFSPAGQVRRHARPVPVARPLIRPEPGMLPLVLRRTDPIRARHTVADEIENPNRVPPGRRRPRSTAPALITRGGQVNPAARPRPVTRPLITPEPGMLPLTVRRTDPVQARHTLADELDDPNRVPPSRWPSPQRAPGLITPQGRVNRLAVPTKPAAPTPAVRRPPTTDPTPPSPKEPS
ncbi:hypothetical protein [Actinokineospora sp. NBRC 105648]|uniref:hypothetical protein n=1 Tax=Actinokineospora sp. NBRC 105648 TaxID=3032206 RepID=UPI0024A10552|nr:hypothetical protein [Actinokineospora sp. NBRC 105648]GLZ37855.1 hypothetical protein Acsp05_14790 [Actinokineospora sp. NBRC 105648]